MSNFQINKSRFQQRMHPYRSACLAVAIGISAILLVAVISAVGSDMIGKEMESLGMNSVMLGLEDRDTAQLDGTVYAAMKNLPGVNASSPVVMDTGTCKFGHGDETEVFFWGTSCEAPQIVALDVIHGKMFSQGDLASSARVCMVDEAIAEQYYHRSNIVGKSITLFINGCAQRFQVIGVIRAESNLLSSVTGSVIPNFVYLPYTTLSAFSAKNGYDEILFSTQEADTVKDGLLAAYAPFVPENSTASQTVRITDLCSQKESMEQIMAAVSATMALIAGVALLVSGVSVMNAVGSAVSARRREIGIRKSLGASTGAILAEFIGDVVLGTGLSLFFAVGVGVGGLMLILKVLGLPLVCNYTMVFCGAFAMLAIACGFAFFPAKKAAQMSPADALRVE